ncbi:hypothetical protein [Helicobacter felis]|uniref:hypothetical protein n=1 Tax=Helicobacter felis TaxID=214 RepID=UPI001F1E75AC|nr:hypothetical protein [Helicobacter felis]
MQLQAYERDIRCNFKEPTQEKYALVDLQLVQEIDMAKIATDTKRILLHSSAQELEKISPHPYKRFTLNPLF